jgi:23S rRNA pseudouridine2604 synthase
LRINKHISEAGVCSRRQADAWIEAGRVSVNGVTAVLGTKVAPGDVVAVDGKALGGAKKHVYIALNKPVGIECTTAPGTPDNIVDFVGYPERIYPIGRLDKNSSGLILLTNNGDIVNEILRAAHGHEKEYVVAVDHEITEQFLKDMSRGVRILDTVTNPCKVWRTTTRTFRIILTQGLNRQIRRMCKALGYRVTSLQRVRIINLTLGDLQVGRWRKLQMKEVRALLPHKPAEFF